MVWPPIRESAWKWCCSNTVRSNNRRPDIVVIKKKEKVFYIIAPGDYRINDKKQQGENFQDQNWTYSVARL